MLLIDQGVNDEDTNKIEDEDRGGDGDGDGVMVIVLVVVPGVVQKKEEADVDWVKSLGHDPRPEKAPIPVPGTKHEEETAEETDEGILADVLYDGAAELAVDPVAHVLAALLIPCIVVEPDGIHEGDDDGDEGFNEA